MVQYAVIMFIAAIILINNIIIIVMAIIGEPAKLIFGQNWDFVPKRKKKSCLFCIPSILFVQEKVPFFLVIGDF